MITLQSLGPNAAGYGTFAVNVDGVDSGARVVNGARDWTVHRAGIGLAGWVKASQVVAWLESDEGARWLREAQ